MASRVNVKFVVILSAVVVALGAAVSISAVTLLLKSAEDHAKAGAAAGAKGDWSTAEMHFSKAVAKEKGKAEYLEGWKNALEHQVPETQAAFTDKLQRWFGAVRQLAVIGKNDIAAQEAYLEARRQTWLSGAFDRQAAEAMVTEADAIIATHGASEPGEWERIKRYRAMARLRLLAETPDARDDMWTQAREDLEAALRANPADAESAVGLQSLLMGLSGRAERRGDADAAAALEREARAILPAFIEKYPQNPVARIAFLRRGLAEAVMAFQSENRTLTDTGKAPKDPVTAGREFTEANRPSYEAAIAGIEAMDMATIDLELIQSIRGLEATMEPTTAPARTQELVRRALEKRPDNADLLALRADLLAQQEQFGDAVVQLQQVVELPNKPVGLEGQRLFFQRSQARFLQAMWSLRHCLTITDADAKKSAVASARSYVDKFTATEASDSPRARLAQAWLAYATDDMETCDRLMENLSKIGGLDVDSLLVWSNVALRRQQPGAARDRLAFALRIQPQNVNAAKALGELHVGLREFDQAYEVYSQLVKLYPDRKEFRERLAQVEAARDPSKISGVQDPVERLLFEIDAMARGGRSDPATDGRILELLKPKMIEHNYDPRLVQALALTHRRMGNMDQALAVVTQGAERNPENKGLQNLKVALAAKDEYAMRQQLIGLSGAPELDKVLEQYQLAKEYAKTDDVKAALAEMGRIAPDDVKVLEVRFIEALEAREFDKAETIAADAGRVNADKYQGRTFRARVQAARGEFKAAGDLMQEVVNEGGAQPEAFRLLGRFLQAQGRVDDALDNFRVALGRRPNDPEATKDMIRALIAGGRSGEALTVARNGVNYAAGDREFDDLWLKLEQQVGDANLARDRRERLAAIRPNDRDNLLSLGDIYLRLNDAVKAAQIVERVKALGVDLDVVTLQAAVLWAENKQAEAKAAFTAFAEAAPDNRAKLETGIAAARFLFSRSDVDGSATVLESVRQYQDPKAMEADRALSDLFLQAGDSKRGIEPLERILAAGGDTPESTYRKRMVETLMSLGRFTDAERELAPLLRATNPDFVSVLLHASIRGGLNDVTGQRRILDDAVTKFPKEPAVFLRRGQFLAQNDETLRDAIADFSQAAQIAPNLWQTYRLRAGAYARIRNAAGEPTEVDRVIDDLKQALQLNPFDNDLLVGLVSDLLRLNRDAEAQRAVEAAVKVRPREAIIFVQMGNLFQGAGRLKIAQDFFEQAWALNKGDGIAQRMLDSLLDPRSMNVRRAEEIINELGAQRVTANPGFLMAVAKIRTSQNQLQLANRAVLDALRLLDPARDNLMMIWHQDMLRLQPDRRQHIQFLEAAINQGTVPGAADWLGFFRASLQTEDPASLSDGVKGLELLARGANPPIIRLLSWRMLGGKHYGQNRFDLAQAAWTEGLKAFPDDPELNNNLAYLLTVHLNKCAEAIPLAQQAAKSSPRNADIADTLAFALFKCGRVTEALTTYEGALKLVTAARTGVHVLSHYAEALLEHSKQAPTAEERQRLVQQAKDQISMAENILSQPGVQVDEATRAEYDRVKALVGK